MYIIDSLNFAVRKVDTVSGIIFTIIGKGEPGPGIEFESIDNSCIGGPIHEKSTIGLEAPRTMCRIFKKIKAFYGRFYLL